MNKNSTTRQHLERNSEKKKTRRRNNDESMNLTREFIRQFGARSNRGNWVQRGGGGTEAGGAVVSQNSLRRKPLVKVMEKRIHFLGSPIRLRLPD